MSLKLQHSKIIETPDGRVVEMLLADTPEPGENEARIHFVVPVSAEGYPRIPAAQLEALRHVRHVITDEYERIEDIRGQHHANEDWR